MKKDDNSIELFIQDDLQQGQTVRRILFIPFNPNETEKAFRIFDDNNDALFYASTRLHNLNKVDSGYEVDVTNADNLLGKRCELVQPKTRQILLKGRIATKKAEATILNMNKKVV